MGNSLTIINNSKHLVTYVCAYQISQETAALGKLGAGKVGIIHHEFSVPCYLYIKIGDVSESECRARPNYVWTYNPINSPVYDIEEQFSSKGNCESNLRSAPRPPSGKNTLIEDIKATGIKYCRYILCQKVPRDVWPLDPQP
ncbi:hypothetical protein XENTR_v10022984 [Xenopus tropicalis]|nr:hypothetical protein XENTR_v10022984 [Xenopus tropicalis]